MSFRSILQDVRGGIGSLSRRSFDVKIGHSFRSRSHRAPPDDFNKLNSRGDVDEASLLSADCTQGRWAHIPPELLRDVISRIESTDESWPSRKNVVACSGVCRSWRFITKEIVLTPELSGKITYPISLKQPGPREALLQCFIKRDRLTSTYNLYLGLTPTLADEGKFLLAARKMRRAASTDYIISIDADDFSRASSKYIGKLRSNFLGTKFTIYDSQPPHNGAIASTSRASQRVRSKQVSPSPRLAAGNYLVGFIAYELNVLGTRGPRRMQCQMDAIPASAMEAGGVAPTPSELSLNRLDPLTTYPSLDSKSGLIDSRSFSGPITSSTSREGPLLLKNKAPRWHEQLQCWCLNFKGRVTVPSVKNFQLVAATDTPQPSTSQSDYDKVLLQFGKVGKDMFTMDYRYPLSAFQAFAICLSSFDTKLACE